MAPPNAARSLANTRALFLALLLLVSIALVTTPQAHAQELDYTFHVYVDPIHGDDELAFELNPRKDPTWDPARKPLADYPPSPPGVPMFPDPAFAPQPTPGVLQQAPYSFRTLTGGAAVMPHGALDYVLSLFPGTPGAAIPSLPWTNPDTQRRVKWVVIHLLPGLYGPDSTVNAQLSDIHPASGLRFNGEQFPIALPNGISLQGTSALDTILDARFQTTSVIETNAVGIRPYHVSGHDDYFIDGVTIRNARADGGPGLLSTGGFNTSGAGIWIGREFQPLRFSVSNCFIVNNDVGIALEEDPPYQSPPNSPIIVNNTLAWNRIGIWNGYRGGQGSPPNPPNEGNMRPLVLNNIVDTCNPEDQTRFDVVFQGMHQNDVTIAALMDGAGLSVTPLPVTRNGFCPGLVNVALPAGPAGTTWPMPAARSVPPSTPLPAPIVDLAPYMAGPSKPRGLLYVADALRLEIGPISPHDLRLAPHTVADPSTVSPANPIAQLNPLVSHGIALGDTVLRFQSITFANGRVIASKPGLPVDQPNAVEVDRFHAWDWDSEGFGNPRIRCRSGFAVPPAVRSPIDLGADEMDDLIVAGYVPSTRMFGTIVGDNGDPKAHQGQVNFYDLRGSVYTRPQYLTTVGWGYAWWSHTRFRTPAEGCTDCATISWPNPVHVFGSNYTVASTVFPGSFSTQTYRDTKITVAPSQRWWPSDMFPTAGPLKPPIMRNLQCDFSPTLLSDPTPYWGGTWFEIVGANTQLGPFAGDVYASNPWHGSEWSALELFPLIGAPRPIDNWAAYSSATHPTYPSQILSGHLHPPGTFQVGPRVECGPLNYYLLPYAATATFGSFPPCTGGSVYAIGEWGRGDASAGCPDLLPLLDFLKDLGVRYDLQRYSETEGSNLQTFLHMVTEGQAPLGGAQPASSSYLRYPAARRDPQSVLTPSIDAVDLERIRRGQLPPRLGRRR